MDDLWFGRAQPSTDERSKVGIVEALVDGRFREHCRELVLEGRLDWDGFDVGMHDAGAGIPSVAQVGGPVGRPMVPGRAPRRFGRRRRRDGSGVGA